MSRGTVARLLRRQRALHALSVKPHRSVFEEVYLRLFGPWFQSRLGRRYGACLPVAASIGEGLHLPHEFHGLFIAKEAVIGRKALIHQHVTIGVSHHPDGKTRAAPVIGDNVFIGANVTIIGRTVIGDGCRIGAGVTLVDATIPPHSVVVNSSAYNLTLDGPVYPQQAAARRPAKAAK